MSHEANSFRDTRGRTWVVEVNVHAVKRLRSMLNVDLMSVLDDDCRLLAQLHDDPVAAGRRIILSLQTAGG